MVQTSPKTYVFDLDGVIYRGMEPQPHASETLRELRNRGRKVFFFTNNSANSRDDYLNKLSGMDISASKDEIMTSAFATVLYLREQMSEGGSVYVVGGAGLAQELIDADFRVASDSSNGKVDFVVVGLDRQFTYDKLRVARQAIADGAQFIATNTDATFPAEGDVIVPGGGSIVSAVQTAAGIEPVVIGKPQTYALDKILQMADSAPEETVMVGDRLETDILLGNKVGLHTVLPLTGITNLEMALAAPPDMKPKRIIDDLIELLDESWASR